MRIATLTLTILCLALAVPAFANTTFINSGPLDGNDNALFVSGPQFPKFLFGNFQDISDGFISEGTGQVTGGTFGIWALHDPNHGTNPTGFNLSLGISRFGNQFGTIAFGCSNGCGSFLFTNADGYDVYSVNFETSFFGSLATGQEYWFTISNASDPLGSDSEAWDVPNGGLGTPGITCNFRQSGVNNGDCGLGGESFTLIGTREGLPEPSSIMLFGSGIVGLATVMRRKLSL